jgi:2-octaprenylphenol hydroxylase
MHAERYTQHRLALIGDAAHNIHPLAGQGANLGFMDAACLAEFVLEAADCGRDLGSVYHLRKYERWRKGDNLSMMFAMDGFKRLFSNEMSLLSKVRGYSLSITDKVAPVKHAFMRRAMGLEGDLPRLAQRPVR